MIFIKKIRSENDAKEYFVVSSLRDDGDIEIALLSALNFNTYSGLLTSDYIKTRCVKMRMPYETYLSETYSAFMYASPDCSDFEYNITEVDNERILLEWKKPVKEEELIIVLGSVNLSAFVTSDLVMLVFSKLSSELQRMHRENEHLAADQKRLKAEREELLNMLKETNEWKSKLETEMYAKFVVVLNNKKKKIRELLDQLEEYKDANGKRTIDRTTDKYASVKINSHSKKETANNSLDIFSDEELDIPSTSRTGRYISCNQPSKKKMKLGAGAKNEGDLGRKSPSPQGRDHINLQSDVDSSDLFDEL